MALISQCSEFLRVSGRDKNLSRTNKRGSETWSLERLFLLSRFTLATLWSTALRMKTDACAPGTSWSAWTGRPWWANPISLWYSSCSRQPSRATSTSLSDARQDMEVRTDPDPSCSGYTQPLPCTTFHCCPWGKGFFSWAFHDALPQILLVKMCAFQSYFWKIVQPPSSNPQASFELTGADHLDWSNQATVSCPDQTFGFVELKSSSLESEELSVNSKTVQEDFFLSQSLRYVTLQN